MEEEVELDVEVEVLVEEVELVVDVEVEVDDEEEVVVQVNAAPPTSAELNSAIRVYRNSVTIQRMEDGVNPAFLTSFP